MPTVEEIAERRLFLQKRIMTLEWDKNLNQLNEGMAAKYEEYKKELASLSQPSQGQDL